MTPPFKANTFWKKIISKCFHFLKLRSLEYFYLGLQKSQKIAEEPSIQFCLKFFTSVQLSKDIGVHIAFQPAESSL